MMKFKPLLISGIIASQIMLTSSLLELSAITATVRGSLPTSLSESSSLEFNGVSDFWSNNDNGGNNKIYRVSSSGSLKQSITILGASNDDWEEITHNSTRTNMFIGDFGNNNSDRQNLKIYKIPYPTSTSGSTITASTINFSYPDQKKFPSSWKNFDVEGFFSLNGKLYLFTKGDGRATKYTKMYRLPDQPGKYVAKLVDSFYVDSRITAASISPDGKSAVLISNTQIHLFRNFTNNNIFTGQYHKISISGSWTQKEGVAFFSNSLIYISEEGSPGRNKIYSVDLSPYIIAPRISSPDINEESVFESEISVFPNPANSFTFIQNNEIFSHAEVIILNLTGQIIDKKVLDNPEPKIRIETDFLKPGIYTIHFIGDNRKEKSVLLSVIH